MRHLWDAQWGLGSVKKRREKDIQDLFEQSLKSYWSKRKKIRMKYTYFLEKEWMPSNVDCGVLTPNVREDELPRRVPEGLQLVLWGWAEGAQAKQDEAYSLFTVRKMA